MTTPQQHDDEVWKPVVGHEGKYEVSDLGRVRSVDRQQTYLRRDAYSGRDIEVDRTLRGKLLSPGTTSTGHQTVSIGRGNSRTVHSLVLEAFVGPCPDGLEALHFNDLPDDNRLENLRYGTRAANLHDAVRNGRKPIGELVLHSKLTDEKVRLILSDQGKTSAAEFGRKLGVSEATIRQVLNGKSWKHIWKEFEHGTAA